jgi:hypothetical protein
MKRRTVIFTVLLVALILIEVISINEVSANQSPLGKMIDPPLNAKPPIISIYSPQNNTNYTGTLTASISINESQDIYFASDLLNVRYTIDNATLKVPFDGKSVLIEGRHCQYNNTFALPTLLSGNHTLTVEVEGRGYQMYESYFLINSTAKVYFAVSNNSKGFNSSTLGITLTLIIMIISVSILLVYFKRRKKLANKQSFL